MVAFSAFITCNVTNTRLFSKQLSGLVSTSGAPKPPTGESGEGFVLPPPGVGAGSLAGNIS